MIVVIALAMLIFTATTSVLSGLQRAPSAFSAGGGFLISETSAPTIFSSSLDVDMVTALESFPEITATSPEVFAFSSWNGVPFVIRGVDLERLNKTGPRFESFQLVEALFAAGAATALLGSRLADRMGIGLPYTMPVVGSYASKVEFLRLVGTFETGTSLDDEMLVTLDVARFLSGTQDDKVSIIRVATTDPGWLADLLSPEAARFALYDLHTSSVLVPVDQPVTVSVGVRNWGGRAGSATVTFSEAGAVLKQQDVRLNSSSSSVVQSVFAFDSTGQRSIEITVSGDFPVKLYANLTVAEPFLKVSAPSKALLGSSFNITVTKFTGEPAVAFVSFLSSTTVTDSEGKATLAADQLGTYDVTANLSGFADGRASVKIVDPSDYPHSFNPSVASFTVSPSLVQSTDDVSCVVVIENDGTEPGYLDVVLYEDSAPRLTANISLDGMSSYTWSFRVSAPAPGTHYLQVGNISHAIVVEPWYADNPGLVQLVIRYGGSSALSSSSGIPLYRAAKISEGNVAAALFAIGAVSAVLSALAITSIFSKEVAEGRRRLGILKTIGAPSSAIRKLVFQQSLENGLAGTAIGLALGVIVADRLSNSALFLLFGHELRLSLDTGFMLLVFASALAVCVSSALASSSLAVRWTAIRSIRGLGEERTEQRRIDELLGEET